MQVGKWCFIFCLIMVFVGNVTHAQRNFYVEEPKVFNGGLIAGMNFSQVDGDTYFGYHKIGLNAGGVVYVHFTQKIGATMELIYTQKGSRGEDVLESPTIGTYVTKYFMDVNYIEVPVTFHIIAHKFDFEVGASYARLVNSKEWILGDQYVPIDPVHNRFNTSDIDYVFGLAHQVYKGLYVNVRFQYSITSIRPPARIPLGHGYGDMGQYNNLFNLRFMYLF